MRLLKLVESDGLDGTGRGGPPDPRALRLVRVRVVGECLVPLDREDLRGEEGALCVTLTLSEIDDEPHAELLPVCSSQSSLSLAGWPRKRPAAGYDEAAEALGEGT